MSVNYRICACGLRVYDQEKVEVLWCYEETCIKTPNRWPTPQQAQEFGIDLKALGRPGWQPSSRAKEKSEN